VFDADNVYNEYLTDPGVGASSEWVVTFPTKRFYVDPAIVGTTPDDFIEPFEQVFGSVVAGQSCFGIGLAFWDREENQPGTSIGFSPPPITGSNSLCYEAQTISFNQSGVGAGTPTAILGSNLGSNVATSTFVSGWLDLGLGSAAHVTRPSEEGNIFTGLPVTGFLVTNYVNDNANPGVLGNYAGLYRHRISRSVATSVD